MFEQWTDKNNQKRSKHGVTVTVETMQMLGEKDTANHTSTSASSQYTPS